MFNYKSMNQYKNINQLKKNTTYLFYGQTGKGSKFYTTGFVKEVNHIDKESTKKNNKLDVYLDQENWNDSPNITHFLELSY